MKATIKDFSIYRSAIMGMAILFIMGYHSGVIWHGGFGVEIFLIMSGIGINYSLSKKPLLSDFYKKRLKRVLPCYVLCGSLFYLLIKHYAFYDYMQAISTYSFWVSGIRFAWFIPVIMFYYLISPCVFRFSEKQMFIMGGVIAILLLVPSIYDTLPKSLESVLRRLPSFLVGFAIGKMLFSNQYLYTFMEFRSYIGVLLLLCGYGLLVILKLVDVPCKTCLIIPYLFSAVGLTVIVVSLCKQSKLVRKFLDSFGTISLELYMIHEFFFLIPLRPYITNNYVLFLLTVPMAYLVSLLTHMAIACLTRNQ